MKIYNKIVISMVTGKILKENSFEYKGEIARCCSSKTTVEAPKPSAEEIELQRMQLTLLREQKVEQARMRPFILEAMGLKTGEAGDIVQIPEAERLASMTEQERGSYDLLMAQQARSKKALAGELDISPALEKNLVDRKTQLTEALNQRLGSNWITTTAGQQAMATFDQQAGLLREEARRGELAGGMGLYLSQQQQYLSDISGQRRYGQAMKFGGTKAGLFSQQGQAQQPYQYYKGLQHQANIANAQNEANRQAGLMGGIGKLVGSGVQAYGTYAGLQAMSSRVLKKNIKTISCPIEQVQLMRGVDFDWMENDNHNKGVIAEELEAIMPEAIVKIGGVKGVEYHQIIPVLIEAIKALQKQIDTL